MKNELKFMGVVVEIAAAEFIHSKNNGKDYIKQEIVVEETDEQYPNSIVLECFREDGKPDKLSGIAIDDVIDVTFNVKARAYDTTATAEKPSRRIRSTSNSIWTCVKQSTNLGAAPYVAPPFQSAADPIPAAIVGSAGEGSDLPF